MVGLGQKERQALRNRSCHGRGNGNKRCAASPERAEAHRQAGRSIGPRCRAVLLCAIGLLVPTVFGQTQPHLNRPVRGGMPGLPILTGVELTTNGLRLTWEGPPGYYRIEYRTDLNGAWRPLGPATHYLRAATITGLTSNAFFRVVGPAPQYAGAEACAVCHEEIHAQELQTRHAGALATLERIGQANNPACLPCHTVGHGLPTGFVSATQTPHLGGVQCESCHGPAAQHAANETDPVFRPRVELAAQMCGGCHNQDSHKPHFEQWAESGHALVTEDMNPPGRINSCGRCHSGASRMALLRGEDPALTVAGDANQPITCVVCHDPHRKTPHPAQLRNPLVSFVDYSLAPGDDFGRSYNPDVQICAQCHNQRGATWTSNARPPHYSPQYNMLLGTAGLWAGSEAPVPATHARLEKQCVSCHMVTEGGTDAAHPAFSGHTFAVRSYDGCRSCHPEPGTLVEFTQLSVALHIQRVKAALDFWAITRAPEPLRKYGSLAWEYAVPGKLSNPTGVAQVQGPRSSTNPAQDEQRWIPERIRKARFNLYLVVQDGSYGVHHGPHTAALLDTALQWVAEELGMTRAAVAAAVKVEDTGNPP
jgi:hypothetical protein